MLEVTGYHTLEDRGNAQQLEDSGPIKCISRNAWLGVGYYFWDTEIKWAHKWGEHYSSYLIFSGSINITNRLYDLFGTVLHINDFIECINHLAGIGYFKSRKDILIPLVIEYLKRETKFSEEYDCIRCADYPSDVNVIGFKRGTKEVSYLGGYRVQICLITKESLNFSTYTLVYPENL